MFLSVLALLLSYGYPKWGVGQELASMVEPRGVAVASIIQLDASGALQGAP